MFSFLRKTKIYAQNNTVICAKYLSYTAVNRTSVYLTKIVYNARVSWLMIIMDNFLKRLMSVFCLNAVNVVEYNCSRYSPAQLLWLSRLLSSHSVAPKGQLTRRGEEEGHAGFQLISSLPLLALDLFVCYVIHSVAPHYGLFRLYVSVGWLVVLRIYVALAIFQSYHDSEAGDNQSLKS